MDAACGEGMVENVREQFLDAAKRAMAEEREAKDELAKPGLGDGQPEEQLRGVGRRRGKGEVEGVLGVALLLVDELATDVVLVGEVGDGLALEGIESELLAGLRWQQTSGTGRDGSRRNR